MPLSNKQMEYLAIAWACFDVEPKIDYEKFHKLAGLASAHSAREVGFMDTLGTYLVPSYSSLADPACRS